MNNGTYVAGNVSSGGSYYNPRVANTLTASESITANKTYPYNICPHNWTLMTADQMNAINNTYYTVWNYVAAGWFSNTGTTATSSQLNVTRTANTSGNGFWYLSGSSSSQHGTSQGAFLNEGFTTRCAAI